MVDKPKVFLGKTHQTEGTKGVFTPDCPVESVRLGTKTATFVIAFSPGGVCFHADK